MDFYNYYLRRLDGRMDKLRALSSVKDIAIRLLDEGPIPVGIESAAALLAALHEWKNPEGIELVPIFQEVELALSSALYGVRADLELTDAIWASESHGDPPDDPPRQVHSDDEPKEDPWESPTPSMIESENPDYAHWENWGPDDWRNFQGFKEKVLAAAKCNLSTLGFVVNTLAAVEANIGRLSIVRKCEVANWCSDVADNMYEVVELALQNVLSPTFTREGRLVQKQMIVSTPI